MVGIGAFRVFMKTILNIEPYYPLKPFFFIRPNSLSRAEDLAAVNHNLSSELGLKSGLRYYGSSRSS